MEIIRNFKDITKEDAVVAGGKGTSLGEMTRAGIPVPSGFVLLSNAFSHFVEETDLNVEIDAILHTVDHRDIHTVDAASEKIQEMILETPMPKDIAREVKAHFKKLGAKFVAVRSSATAEDGASAAWAGQLDSFLNTSEKNLLENVKHCWASLFTPRAIFYRFEKKLHKTIISVAVVVQKMVESEVSGIAFSVHPVTEDRNQLIIEASLGLGEAIVSGQITPDSYVVEKNPRRIIDKNITEQERGLYRVSLNSPFRKGVPSPAMRGAGGFKNPSAHQNEPLLTGAVHSSHSEDGTLRVLRKLQVFASSPLGKGELRERNEWRDIPREKGAAQKLSDSQILELAELVLKIEKHYGFPSDIEWAYEKGKFYIVQSRPITTLKNAAETPTKLEAEEEKSRESWHRKGDKGRGDFLKKSYKG